MSIKVESALIKQSFDFGCFGVTLQTLELEPEQIYIGYNGENLS